MVIEMNKEEKLIKESNNSYTPLEKGSKYRTVMERDIVKDYQEGLSIREIKEKYHISTGLVYTVLNNHKVPKRREKSIVARRVRHITGNPQRLKELINDYQFMNNKDLYDKYSIHKNGLYYILDLYGVNRKSDEKDTILEGNKELVTE